MGFINLPATLQNLFASLETRILKLETANRFTAPNVTTDPSLPRKGDIVLNTTSNSLKYVDNTGAFIPLGASTAVSAVTATAPITSTGGLTPNIALTNVGTAGTYTKVTTDASGRVSSGTTLAAADIPNTLNSTTTVNDEFRVKNTGSGAGKIEVGYGATANQFAYIDLVGDTTYPDYGLRVLRGNTGANAPSYVEHRGTGQLNLQATDAGAIQLNTNGVVRIGIDSTGASNFYGLIVGKPNTGGTVANSNDTGSMSVRSSASTDAASMSFHRPGIYAINMGLDTDNGFKIGGWSSGATPYFQINTSGHLRMPSQPTINGSCTNTAATNGFANSFSALTNVGFTVGANLITVPSAGNYLITFNTISNLSTGRVDAQIYINGANPVSILTEDNGTGYHGRSLSIVRTLAASDYVQFANTNWYQNTTTGYVEWRTFSITKLS